MICSAPYTFLITDSLLVLQDAVKELSYELFHEHKQLKDREMKERIKVKLAKDKHCSQQLQKLEEKGYSFDDLWDQKIHSDVSSILLLSFVSQ